MEGHLDESPAQKNVLQEILVNPKKIAEIGFNGGHSSSFFLSSHKDAVVYSFDIGTHDYVLPSKRKIDELFPNRHTLILGDSTTTIPLLNIGSDFDVIFIDGGHDYPTPKHDILNCRRFANKNTTIIMDDVSESVETSWNIGPLRAWKECISEGIVCETKSYEFGDGRGMRIGHYIF